MIDLSEYFVSVLSELAHRIAPGSGCWGYRTSGDPSGLSRSKDQAQTATIGFSVAKIRVIPYLKSCKTSHRSHLCFLSCYLQIGTL